MSMLKSSLALLTDPVRDVRLAFSRIPCRSFRQSSMDVIALFTDKITSIDINSADAGLVETLIYTILSLGNRPRPLPDR